MARKGYGRHKKVVTGIPNDPDKEVSVDAWNDDIDSKGMLGLESTSATIVISSGNLTPTDTWTVVESETSPSADDLANILTTETSTEDILFIVGKSGDTITLKHQATGAGQIHTSTGADKTLDTNVPTLLIRRGTDWYEFGGSSPIAGTNIDVTGSTVSFDPTGGVDMLQNNLINVGYFESNATNPAVNGTIRLGTGEQIKSRNSLNSADSVFGYNALDVFEIGNSGAIDYTFAFNEADWNSNDLRNVGFYESNATNPATSGAIRLGSTESLAWRNNANSADLALTINGDDQLTFNGVPVGGSGSSSAGVYKARIASTANVNLASATDPNPIDGVTLTNNDRILLKDQSTGAENGIYTAVTATDPTTWVRSSDFNTSAEVTDGALIVIQEGTFGADTTFRLTTNEPITLDTTALTFTNNINMGSNGANGIISNVLAIEQEGGNTATNGIVRATNNGRVSWRNAGNTNEHSFQGYSDGIQMRIDGNVEYQFSSTQADFNGNNLVNVGYFESNATTPADSGAIRLGSTQEITWRNAGNTNNHIMRSNANGLEIVVENGGATYNWNIAEMGLNNKALRDFSYIESNANNPADAGAVRLGNAELLTWRNNANTDNHEIYFDGSDVLNFIINSTPEMKLNTASGLVVQRMIQGKKGSDIASDDAPTIPKDGSYFDITGTTQINHFTTTNIQAGTVIILQFDGSVTLTHQAGTPTGDEKDLWLSGATNASMTANDTITLVYDGTNWRETARSVN